MSRRLLALIASVAVVATILAAACGRKTAIKDVLADPGRFQTAEVELSGKVTDSLGLLGRGFYRLEDETGSIWVFSTTGVPRRDARVTVAGTVKDIASFEVPDAVSRALSGGVLLVERQRTTTTADR